MNLQNLKTCYCEITDVSEECTPFVFVVFFCREVGGSRILRNVLKFLPEYTVSVTFSRNLGPIKCLTLHDNAGDYFRA